VGPYKLEHTEEDGESVERVDVPSSSADTLLMCFDDGGTVLVGGGPVIGVGARLDTPEARARVAYEWGGPPFWLLYALGAEASTRNRYTFVPTAEIVSPYTRGILPSLGVGMGSPLGIDSGRLYPGLRAQMELSWRSFSVLAPVDIFPGERAAHQWQWALFVQGSL